MSYQHIENLYRSQAILLFRECFAMEKIHGTSARVRWKEKQITYGSGGASANRFRDCFDDAALREACEKLGHAEICVYGEAYGEAVMRQGWRYGDGLRFVAFEVQIGGLWLAVPQAEEVVTKLGLGFVHYVKVPTDLDRLDAERDAPSVQARRNGIDKDVPREGVVLRPLIEMTLNNGDRIVAKHKVDEARETATPRPVVDPAQMQVLVEADAIAVEWVTETRLQHVLDHLKDAHTIRDTGRVVAAMTEDVLREAKGEIVDSRAARGAIGKRAAQLFKKHWQKL